MLSPNAILIAGVLVFLGLIALIGFGMFFAFRFMATVAVLKAAPDAKSAASMLRAINEDPKQPEKQPMEMPATGVDELANSPEAIENIRKKQDPSPDPY